MSEQTDLSVILDEIAANARNATTGQYEAVKRLADIDCPALVKALRHSMKNWGHGVEAEITAILQPSSEPKEKEN